MGEQAGQYDVPVSVNEEQLSPLLTYLHAGDQAGFVEHFQEWQGSDPYAFFQGASRVGGALGGQGLQLRLGADGQVSVEPAPSWQYGRADLAQPGEPAWAVAAPAGNLMTPNRPGSPFVEQGSPGSPRFGMAQGLPDAPAAPAAEPQPAPARDGASDLPPTGGPSLGSIDNVTSIFNGAGTNGGGASDGAAGSAGAQPEHGGQGEPAGVPAPLDEVPAQAQEAAAHDESAQQAEPSGDRPKDGIYWDHDNRAYYSVENGRWAESHMLGIQSKPSTMYERDNQAQQAAGQVGKAENPDVKWDGGHGAAADFGGHPGEINLSAMVRGLNRGAYKTMENAIRTMITQAAQDDAAAGRPPAPETTPEERRTDPFRVDTGVDLHVRGVYPPGSDVPSHYEIILDNRGTTYRTTFLNQPGPQPRWNEKDIVPDSDW